jgi:hypothetical protein
MLAPAEAIEETHAHVKSYYKGYTAYLEWIGLKVLNQAKLKHLIAPSPDDRKFMEKEEENKSGPFLSDQLEGGPRVTNGRDSKRQDSSRLSFSVTWQNAPAAKEEAETENMQTDT